MENWVTNSRFYCEIIFCTFLDYFDVTELKSQVTLAMMIFEKRYQMMPKKEILAPPIKGMDMDRMRREIKAIFDENRVKNLYDRDYCSYNICTVFFK